MENLYSVWLVIKAIGSWIDHQNWWILGPALVGYLNMIASGTRVMGWMHISNFCGKLEEAIAVMVQAWINRRQFRSQEEAMGNGVNRSGVRVDNFGGGNIEKPKDKEGCSDLKYVCFLVLLVICGCAFSRTMTVHITGNNIRSPYGSGDADISYNSTTSFGGCRGNSENAELGR